MIRRFLVPLVLATTIGSLLASTVPAAAADPVRPTRGYSLSNNTYAETSFFGFNKETKQIGNIRANLKIEQKAGTNRPYVTGSVQSTIGLEGWQARYPGAAGGPNVNCKNDLNRGDGRPYSLCVVTQVLEKQGRWKLKFSAGADVKASLGVEAEGNPVTTRLVHKWEYEIELASYGYVIIRPDLTQISIVARPGSTMIESVGSAERPRSEFSTLTTSYPDYFELLEYFNTSIFDQIEGTWTSAGTGNLAFVPGAGVTLASSACGANWAWLRNIVYQNDTTYTAEIRDYCTQPTLWSPITITVNGDSMTVNRSRSDLSPVLLSRVL